MARWLTVLIALVAQGMALVSPVCFVRCVGADGHECVELAGQGCHCCDCRSQDRVPQVCGVATCCDHGHDQEEEQEVPVGPQIAGQDCSCLHSPLESAPQNLSKSLAADVLSPWHNMWLAPMELNDVARVRALEEASLWPSLLRPHESPQLTVLATVVLRV
jgi:hypothetical protein